MNKTKLTPQKILDTLTIPKYTDDEVVASMPTDDTDEPLEIFTLDKYVTDDELEKEYESRGLVVAPPYALIKAYKDSQPQKYIATHWKDAKGNWYYIAFSRWHGGERRVHVNRHGSWWGGYWWFVGLRKSSKLETSALSEIETLDLERAIEIVKKEGYKIFKEI